ncbi:hypothetical protein PRIPAC_85881, partial [Pristionchus pacificus]
ISRMADDSKTILRWEIDNTTEKFATGKVESEIFDKGGFTWTMSAEKDAYRDGKTNFTLRCGADHNGAWRCETEVEVREYQENGINFDVACTEERFCFNREIDTWKYEHHWSWDNMAIPGWISDNKVVLEYHINITNAESDLIADPSMFAAPNRMSNVILRIGDKKIHVSKEYLSVHSPAFEALFFGDFAEKGKEEVEIKDVVYEEFIDLLHLMYLKTMKITDRTVLYILKLSDRFQIESVLNQAILHLSDSKKFDVMAKLLIADQYNLAELKVKCLNSFVNVVELHEKMLTSPEYDKFSSDMKAAICDRIMKLKVQ